jgi:hypothetical protein
MTEPDDDRRHAACSCGQLRVQVLRGDPVRISVCHCLACQRRTGSAFGAQARWPAENVRITGEHTDWERISEHGDSRVFSFCPICGSTVFFTSADRPGVVAVTLGTLADPAFLPPRVSVWEQHKHPWFELTGDMEHSQ